MYIKNHTKHPRLLLIFCFNRTFTHHGLWWRLATWLMTGYREYCSEVIIDYTHLSSSCGYLHSWGRMRDAQLASWAWLPICAAEAGPNQEKKFCVVMMLMLMMISTMITFYYIRVQQVLCWDSIFICAGTSYQHPTVGSNFILYWTEISDGVRMSTGC